jgi:predicted aconitase
MRIIACALALSIAAVAGAKADVIVPEAGYTIDLGPVHGVAYYTVAEDGYRLVATLASGEAGQPVRVSATLAPEQTVSVSVPAEAGAADAVVSFARRGDRIVIDERQLASN